VLASMGPEAEKNCLLLISKIMEFEKFGYICSTDPIKYFSFKINFETAHNSYQK
jgi:hypothetical protein